MHIVHPDVEKYIEGLSATDDPTLKEMEQIAKENDFPIIGPEVGRLLYILAKSSGAEKVLELGSGYGYSAYWFAKALPENGLVFCTDTHETNRDKALQYFERAGLDDKIEFKIGGALQVIDELEGYFDIIFNDIDKEDYAATIDKAAGKLKQGGLFITDNSLWYGKVASDEEPDRTTKGVLDFNEKLMADPRFETVILPIRDGVALAIKK